ncbi:MAG TPA: DUF748 domain-containing protein, partial [Anaeromyxobacteraceae bacterium]|nr:DUF748 domain-containing protein [Anaeromyxobacteraceae bacterium]
QVRLEGLRSDPSSTSQLAASLVWNGRGRVSAKGTVKPFGNAGTLDLDVTDLDLPLLQPYLERDVSARLVDGRVGVKARVEFDASRPVARWTFAGDFRLDGLAVAENGNEDLLRWRALEVTGIQAGSAPPRASVRLVKLVDPRAKVYVWENGETSIVRALRPGKPPRPAAGAPATARAPAAPAWRTSIGAVRVVRGRASFVDKSVAPPALVNVTDSEVTVRNLSSDPKVRSAVDVRLQIEGASPLQVTGTVNPLQTDAFTDLAITSKGVDLSPVGPYSGKFLGYGIQKGKLDLDLRYKVEKRVLAATNVVRVNQFTLGNATASPDATKIPVRLALALLKDKDGVILLDVPIEGRLDDPEFHLGKVIWRTILNLLVKVAASPFKALAALAGGGEADLSMVEFTPGTADPLPQGQDALARLARSLAQRPELGLELEGSADAEHDGPALRRAAVERSIRRARAAAMRPPPASVDEVSVSADERARLLRQAYDAAFPAAERKRGEPAPTQQQMEERLVSAAQVPADAYGALAAERAQRARAALLAAGLDQSRLFLTQGGGRAGEEKGPRVYFSVR